jgi:nicotinamide-nucleotide amidase
MASAPTAYVVSQGEELLTGLTLDTNAHYLCRELTELGLRVRGVVTAGDRLAEIEDALQRAVSGSSVVVCTGGLGPTADDLTSEAAARAFDRPLHHDPEAMSQVEARYAAVGRPMAPANRKQALMPHGAGLLVNRQGTAPGFSLDVGETRLYCLPGVPSEMKTMFAEIVRADVRAHAAVVAPLRRTFRVMGRGESQLQGLLGDVPDRFPGVELGFRTCMPENHVKLVGEPTTPGWEDAVALVRERLSRDCFTEQPDEELAAVVGRMLVARGQTLATAESCSGGWVAHLVVSETGSSQWFERGWVTYSNRSKEQELGVPAELLETHGAVSSETARAMAEGARAAAGTDWAVSVTGIAGPGGGTPNKPVGTVCVAVAGPAGTHERRLQLGARERTMNRRFSTWFALEMLRRQLLRARS